MLIQLLPPITRLKKEIISLRALHYIIHHINHQGKSFLASNLYIYNDRFNNFEKVLDNKSIYKIKILTKNFSTLGNFLFRVKDSSIFSPCGLFS